MALSKITALSMAAATAEANCAPQVGSSLQFVFGEEYGKPEVREAAAGCPNMMMLASPEVMGEDIMTTRTQVYEVMHKIIPSFTEDDCHVTDWKLILDAKTDAEKIAEMARALRWLNTEAFAMSVERQYQMLALDMAKLWNEFQASNPHMPRCSMVDVPGGDSQWLAKIEQSEPIMVPCTVGEVFANALPTCGEDTGCQQTAYDADKTFLGCLFPEFANEFEVSMDDQRTVEWNGLNDCNSSADLMSVFEDRFSSWEEKVRPTFQDQMTQRMSRITDWSQNWSAPSGCNPMDMMSQTAAINRMADCGSMGAAYPSLSATAAPRSYQMPSNVSQMPQTRGAASALKCPFNQQRVVIV